MLFVNFLHYIHILEYFWFYIFRKIVEKNKNKVKLDPIKRKLRDFQIYFYVEEEKSLI